MSTASSISGGGGGVKSGGGSHGGGSGGTGNDTQSTRGRSRRSLRRKDGPQTQSFCQDSNLPGSKPRLGTVGRQLSQATYVKSFSHVGIYRI